MTAHPFPFDGMPRGGGIEPLPEIDILYWLSVSRAPTSVLPAINPFGNAVPQILTVAI